MKNAFTYIKSLGFAAAATLILGLTTQPAIAQNKTTTGKNNTADTTKPGNNTTGKASTRLDDLDKAMKELEVAMKKLEADMKQFDGEKLEKEIKEAMQKVNWQKIQEEVKASLKEIDMKKMQVEMEKAMKEAEFAMSRVDLSKLEESMKKLAQELSENEKLMQLDGEKIRKEVAAGMEKAKEGMEKAKAEMQNLTDFTDALEKDGLINKKKGFKIQVKDGELYINGTKQSKEVSDKYRKYYPKNNFTINTNGDSIITL